MRTQLRLLFAVLWLWCCLPSSAAGPFYVVAVDTNGAIQTNLVLRSADAFFASNATRIAFALSNAFAAQGVVVRTNLTALVTSIVDGMGLVTLQPDLNLGGNSITNAGAFHGEYVRILGQGPTNWWDLNSYWQYGEHPAAAYPLFQSGFLGVDAGFYPWGAGAGDYLSWNEFAAAWVPKPWTLSADSDGADYGISNLAWIAARHITFPESGLSSDQRFILETKTGAGDGDQRYLDMVAPNLGLHAGLFPWLALNGQAMVWDEVNNDWIGGSVAYFGDSSTTVVASNSTIYVDGLEVYTGAVSGTQTMMFYKGFCIGAGDP